MKTSNTIVFLPREPYTNGQPTPINNIVKGERGLYSLATRKAKALKWGYKFGFVFKKFNDENK